MPTKVVIIGGSFAASHAGRAILEGGSDVAVELTLLAPSEYCMNCVSTPRILIEPEKIDRIFFNLPRQFESQISKNLDSRTSFKFVKGYATSLDVDSKTIHYESGTDSRGILEYDYLVIATGQSSSSYFKLEPEKDHEYTKKGLLKLSKSLEEAPSVAVIGGGPTGVEIVGELAEHYKRKEITLITGTSAPLSFLPGSAPRSATRLLEKLGVSILNSKKVASHTDEAVVFSDGTTSKFGLVLPAFCTHPNSQYLPKELLDSKGFVLADSHLSVPEHPEILVLGDIVSGGPRNIYELKYVTPSVLKAWVSTMIYRQAGSSLKEYRKPTRSTIVVVPISRNGGIAFFFGWNLPSIFAWMFKARTFLIEYTEKMFS